MSVPDVLSHLLAANEVITSRPWEAIQFLAQQAGIDLGQMSHDPQAAAMRDQRIAQAVHQQYAQQAQAEKQAKAVAVYSLVERFSAGKDHWTPEFENEMVGQIEHLRRSDPSKSSAEVLKEAESRTLKILGLETRDTKLERIKKADQAKRMAALNVGKKSLSVSHSVPKDMRTEMAEIYDRIRAAG